MSDFTEKCIKLKEASRSLSTVPTKYKNDEIGRASCRERV